MVGEEVDNKDTGGEMGGQDTESLLLQSEVHFKAALAIARAVQVGTNPQLSRFLDLGIYHLLFQIITSTAPAYFQGRNIHTITTTTSTGTGSSSSGSTSSTTNVTQHGNNRAHLAEELLQAALKALDHLVNKVLNIKEVQNETEHAVLHGERSEQPTFNASVAWDVVRSLTEVNPVGAGASTGGGSGNGAGVQLRAVARRVLISARLRDLIDNSVPTLSTV